MDPADRHANELPRALHHRAFVDIFDIVHQIPRIFVMSLLPQYQPQPSSQTDGIDMSSKSTHFMPPSSTRSVQLTLDTLRTRSTSLDLRRRAQTSQDIQILCSRPVMDLE